MGHVSPVSPYSVGVPRAADLDLARRCADGDAPAWERFARDYGSLLRSAASRALGTGAGVEPDDVASEVTADLLREGGRALREFRGDASLRTWLWVLATRKALAMRAAARAARPGPAHPDEADPAPSPPEAAQVREALALAQEALDRLPPRERLALSLVYLRGWTQRDAARFLGVQVSQAGMLLRRARGRLRESAGNPVTSPPPVPSEG
jgi:RNA polymerase sigma-70 factor (ECF subfamily)